MIIDFCSLTTVVGLGLLSIYRKR